MNISINTTVHLPSYVLIELLDRALLPSSYPRQHMQSVRPKAPADPEKLEKTYALKGLKTPETEAYIHWPAAGGSIQITDNSGKTYEVNENNLQQALQRLLSSNLRLLNDEPYSIVANMDDFDLDLLFKDIQENHPKETHAN